MGKAKTFYTGQNAWKNSCKPEWKQKKLQKIQPLILLSTIFHEKGSPFVYLLSLTNVAPSTYLVKNFISLLSAVNALFFYIEINLKNSLYSDVVLFFFSFLPLALAVNKSPAVYILSPALDGLWKGNKGSVNRLSQKQNVFLTFQSHIIHQEPIHLLAPLGPLTDPNDRFPHPSIYLN